MKYFILATEDELSEAVGYRLIDEIGFSVSDTLGKRGSGYLKSKISDFCQIAKHQPVLLITDLDRTVCPSLLRTRWLQGRGCPNGLIFRIAVQEIEAWLLADHSAMQALLGNYSNRKFEIADSVRDPKDTLLNLARRAPRNVRSDLIINRGAIASQGLGYNARLCDFVKNRWDPARAELRSSSLQRARLRLKQFAKSI
jgi:hypothetical protein